MKKQPTKERIIEAALEEFSHYGIEGASMEAIARKASCNKALVYRHFKNRHNLFASVMKRKVEERLSHFKKQPDDIAQAFAHWFKATRDDPHFMRLIMWESIHMADDQPVESELRKKYYESQISVIERYQEEGKLPKVNPRMLFISFLSMIVFPVTFPSVTKLATGLNVRSKKFEKELLLFLKRFSESLLSKGDSS